MSTMTVLNNLLSANDSDFETSVAGWTANTGVGVTQSASAALSGTHCLQAQATVVGTPSIQTNNVIAVAPGVEYSAGAYVMCPSGARNVQVLINWQTSTGGYISTTGGLYTGVQISQWAPCTASGIAPAAAARAQIVVTFSTTVSTDKFYMDVAYFVPGSSPVAASAAYGSTGASSIPMSFAFAANDSGVIVVAYNQGTSTTLKVSTITDSAGNTWTLQSRAAGNTGVAGSMGIEVWTMVNSIATTSTCTVTLSAAASSCIVWPMDIANSWAYDTAFVEFSAANALTATGTSVTSPISPNIEGDLLINAVCSNAQTPTNALGNPQSLVVTAGTTTAETQLAVTYQQLQTTGVAVTTGGTVGTATYMASATIALRAQPYIVSDIPSTSTASDALIAQGLTGYDTVTIMRTNTLTGASNPVRTANGITQTGDILEAVDYEASLGVQNQYVVTAVHHNIDGSTTSATSAPYLAEVPYVQNEAWVKAISQPNLNVQVNVVGPMADVVYPPRNTVYNVLGTQYPVVVGDVLGARTGTLTVRTDTFAAAQALLASIALGQVMLFQAGPSDNFPDMYFMVTNTGVTLHSLNAASVNPVRSWDLEFTEVASPSGSFSLLATNTWSQVLSFGTWTAVKNDRATWLNVLNVQYGAGSPV